MSALPPDIRDRIRQKIWEKADELNWSRISDSERTTWYENWSKDREVGGVIAHFMDPRRVRVYIKDSLLKPYLRACTQDGAGKALLAVGLDSQSIPFKKSYDKPHGLLLSDGRVVCWGNSRDWKSIVISVFERAYKLDEGTPYAAVLLETGKSIDSGVRQMISAVGSRLGLNQVVWIE